PGKEEIAIPLNINAAFPTIVGIGGDIEKVFGSFTIEIEFQSPLADLIEVQVDLQVNPVRDLTNKLQVLVADADPIIGGPIKVRHCYSHTSHPPVRRLELHHDFGVGVRTASVQIDHVFTGRNGEQLVY